MSDLMPCPFCGGKAKLLPTIVRRNGVEEEFYRVECAIRECNVATLPWYPLSRAIAAWNRRTPASAEAEA